MTLNPSPAVRSASSFVAHTPLQVALCSALILIPCYWHRHIQATDLGSHVYNAWLAQLIRTGQVPGLYIVPQHNNVLFDLMLSTLFRAFGPLAAERIAVSIAVLIFFWGGFALSSAAAGRAAWGTAPLLAMICYGFMFNMGFFNLYLSVGISLFAMAIIWRGHRWDFLLLPPLAGLVWMAHLLGTAGLLSLGAFLAACRLLRWRMQLAMTTSAICIYFLARWYVMHRFELSAPESNFYWMSGADQLVVYTSQYEWIGLAVFATCVIALTLTLRIQKMDALRRIAVWGQIYAIVAIAVFFSPGAINHPTMGVMGYLPDRASLYTAILLCVLIAALKPSKWLAVPLSLAAAMFFTLLYFDTGELDRLETRTDQVVAPLAPGQRVLATIFPSPGSRIHEQHFADRACIGHCFFVGNYEVSSGQFRIKATPGNRLVETNPGIVKAMQLGVYKVRPADLPVNEVYSCGPDMTDICLHPLQAGEYNGMTAYDSLALALKTNSAKRHP